MRSKTSSELEHCRPTVIVPDLFARSRSLSYNHSSRMDLILLTTSADTMAPRRISNSSQFVQSSGIYQAVRYTSWELHGLVRMNRPQLWSTMTSICNTIDKVSSCAIPSQVDRRNCGRMQVLFFILLFLDLSESSHRFDYLESDPNDQRPD
jgi:hypothetical protein